MRVTVACGDRHDGPETSTPLLSVTRVRAASRGKARRWKSLRDGFVADRHTCHDSEPHATEKATHASGSRRLLLSKSVQAVIAADVNDAVVRPRVKGARYDSTLGHQRLDRSRMYQTRMPISTPTNTPVPTENTNPSSGPTRLLSLKSFKWRYPYTPPMTPPAIAPMIT